MKKTTKISALICGLLISVVPSSAGLAQNVEAKNNIIFATSTQSEPLIKYDFLPDDEMPILGYFSIPNANAGSAGSQAQNPSFLTKSNFLTYKAAGFNIVSGLYEREPFYTPDIYKALELAQETGLVYFVNDNDFRSESYDGTVPMGSYEQVLENMQNKWYLNETAFGGLAVKDEPSCKDYDGMAKVNKALKELTDGKVLYSNLFPSYAGHHRFGIDEVNNDWSDYEEYVTRYVNEVKPDILAYDYYVFMKKDGTLKNPQSTSNPIDVVQAEININEYFRSLSLFREVSLQQNIPFWVTVASYNHRSHNQFTQKQTEWTVNTSLAYGAKGIQYYTYWSAIDSTTQDDWENHNRSGLVTLNGTPHDTYYRIQKINNNIKVVDDVLMKATHKGIMQFGDFKLDIQGKDVLYGYGLLNNIKGGDTFVGCFEKDGKPVFYIVNNSVTSGRKTFVANFIDKVNVRLTNLEGVTNCEQTYAVGFNLSGGEAILLEVL